MALPVNRDARHCVVALQADDGDLFRDISRVYVSRVSRALSLAVIDAGLIVGRDCQGGLTNRYYGHIRRHRSRHPVVGPYGGDYAVVILRYSCCFSNRDCIIRPCCSVDFRSSGIAVSSIGIPLIAQSIGRIHGRDRRDGECVARCIAIGRAQVHRLYGNCRGGGRVWRISDRRSRRGVGHLSIQRAVARIRDRHIRRDAFRRGVPAAEALRLADCVSIGPPGV